MNKYRIEVKEECIKFIDMEANSEKEAYLKARKLYFEGKLFDSEDLADVTYWVREK